MGPSVIEVYESYGIRSVRLPKSVKPEDALDMALDIWDDHDGVARVRVLREVEPGLTVCVCEFPPQSERDAGGLCA